MEMGYPKMKCEKCGIEEVEEGKKLCKACEYLYSPSTDKPRLDDVHNNNAYTSNDSDNNDDVINNPDYKQKNKILAGVLGIVLGSLGVHDFYLGFHWRGTAHLLGSLITCLFLLIPSAIVGIVEGILILVGVISIDGYGNKIK